LVRGEEQRAVRVAFDEVRGYLVGDFAERVREVARDFFVLKRVGHALAADGASLVLRVDEGEVVGRDAERKAARLGSACAEKLALRQRKRAGEFVNRRDGAAELPAPVALISAGPDER
jgi:hypothetical protein